MRYHRSHAVSDCQVSDQLAVLNLLRDISCVITACFLLLSAQREVVAADYEHFHPSPSDDGYVWANTANAMQSFEFYSSLTTFYANDQLVGTYPLQNRTQVFTRPLEHRLAIEPLMSIGLLGRFDLSASMPIYLKQTSDNYPISSPPAPETSSSGIGDFRLRGKFAFFKTPGRKDTCVANHYNMALATDLYVGTGDADKLMGNGGIEVTPWFLMSYCRPNTENSLGWGATLNVGYRLKRSSILEDIKIGDEVNFLAGLRKTIVHEQDYVFSASLEASMILGLGKRSNFTPANVQHSPAEAVFSLQAKHRSGVGFFVGGGLGVLDGYGAPDIRGIVGLNFRSRPIGFRTKKKLTAVTPHEVATMRFDTSLDVSSILAADPDPDGDKITMSNDKCPMKAEDIDAFEDSDGCPDNDNDNDAIADREDKCPLKAETKNGFQDDDGCPDKNPNITESSRSSRASTGASSRVSIGQDRINIKGTVFFKSGSEQILRRSFSLLDEVASVLRNHIEIHLVMIEGHTDDRGIPDKNVDLSERRAASVAVYLEKAGVAGHRFLTKGFGHTAPVASNRSKAGRAKNRRVVFKIINVEADESKNN